MIIKEYILFSDEQKHQANTVDLEDYLLRRGEKLLPSVSYTRQRVVRP